MDRKISAIILAAGRGERMKSDLPKTLHPVCGRPMLAYVLDLVKDLRIKNTVVVVGYKHRQVEKLLPEGIKPIVQRSLKGSAHAVKQARSALKNFKGEVLVLYADHPLLKKDTVKKLISHHLDNDADVTLLTAKVKDPSNYGRILRDKYASVCRIVEEKDADAYQKDIKEINIGCACFKAGKLFGALNKVKVNPRKREYCLTDAIEILYRQGGNIEAVRLNNLNEAYGINSRADLSKAVKIMQSRINEQHMKNGVSLVDPSTSFIDWGVKIGADTTIYPFTVIETGVKIGRCCSIGPFCHLREKTVIEDYSKIGNFAELTRCRVSKHTLAKHFCYLGDARIGSKVNVGAGVVTANFDGKKKNPTVVKDKAFLGSDTVLIAPVKIGKGALTGAGSVVTRNKNVADYTVVAGVPAKTVRR